MSRISTSPLQESGKDPKFSLYSQLDFLWTESMNASEHHLELKNIDAVPISLFTGACLLDAKAESIAASFGKAMLSLRSFFMPQFLASVSSEGQDKPDLDLERDIWVDMPPLFTRKVVMRARYTGQGEPSAFIDELVED